MPGLIKSSGVLKHLNNELSDGAISSLCTADQLSHQGLFGNWEMLGLMFNSLIPSKDFI